MTFKLYVEGGGDTQSLHSECREGFRMFLEKAGFKGTMPRIVACGGREQAYNKFKIAFEAGETGILLIDSEEFINFGDSPWTFLQNRRNDQFIKPQNASDEHCHFMVVCMESWFLADRETLSKFFGQGFNIRNLPQNEEIEKVIKEDIYARLKSATADCPTKGTYGKSKHSFKILKLICPNKVKQSSKWVERFFDKLHDFLDN